MLKFKKSILFKILGIFILYLIIQPIVIDTSYFQIDNLITPFLWSLLFVYLSGKNHTLIAINSYLIFLLFILAEKINFGGMNINQVLTYTIFSMSIAFLFTFLYQELYFLKKLKIAFIISYTITIISYLLPISFIIYCLNFDTRVTKDILYAVFQTNISEAKEQIFDSISSQWLLFFVMLSFILGFLLYQQEKKETKKIEKSLLLFIVITLISISFIHIRDLTLPKFVLDSFKSYNNELKSFQNKAIKREKKGNSFFAKKQNNGETHIVVIGESLNKKHMGIYNYFRKTTPNLSKLKKNNELLIFNNTYSNYVHTGPSLSYVLTQANQVNKKQFQNTLSIIEIFKKANIETFWLTNQGIGNDIVSVIAKSADHLISVNKSKNISQSASYDEELLTALDKILKKKTKKNRVIFIHLMGSHAEYLARYPHNRFNVFNTDFKKIEVGNLANISHTFSFDWLYQQIIQIADFTDFKSLLKKLLGVAQKRFNEYDNSVLYNDYIVSQIIYKLKKEKGVRSLIYFSDHSEDLTHQLAHNATKFTFEMTQIPMIAWFSNEYQQNYYNLYSQLKQHQNTLFSNGFIYNTLIGVLDINTNESNSTFDLSSEKYHLNKNEAFTLHRKILYTDKKNFFFWQQENINFLKNQNQLSKIIPSDVNTIGKLKDILYDGIKSFGSQVSWLSDKNRFDINLDKILSSVENTQIQQLWIEIKNSNDINNDKIIKYLEDLDYKYDIKEKTILNLKMDSKLLKTLIKNGWHISYSLPRSIITLLKENNIQKIQQKASDIALKMKKENINRISFNQDIYPFVKQYLEPLFITNIQYDIQSNIKLSSKKFSTKFSKSKIYGNKNTKIILVKYKSLYGL